MAAVRPFRIGGRAGVAAIRLSIALGLLIGMGAAEARVRYNAQGQVIDLVCDEHALSAEDRGPCGADGPIWINLHDEEGRLVRQVEHHEGRLIAVREYWREGVLRFSEDRVPATDGPTSGVATAGPGGPEAVASGRPTAEAAPPPASLNPLRTVRRYYYPEGRPRLETFSVDGRIELEREYTLEGALIRETRRDGLGRVTETRWHPNRVLASQLTPAAYGDRPARMLEEYWDNGMLRLRGTDTLSGSRLGLFQHFRRNGVVEREEFYEDGQLRRRVEFDAAGKIRTEEEFSADGTPRSTIER